MRHAARLSQLQYSVVLSASLARHSLVSTVPNGARDHSATPHDPEKPTHHSDPVGHPKDAIPLAEDMMALLVMMLTERHERLIKDQLELFGCSWALVNAVGQSDLGFWVLTIGREKFLLIIEGMPYLNRQPFVDLASVLIRRYLDH